MNNLAENLHPIQRNRKHSADFWIIDFFDQLKEAVERYKNRAYSLIQKSQKKGIKPNQLKNHFVLFVVDFVKKEVLLKLEEAGNPVIRIVGTGYANHSSTGYDDIYNELQVSQQKVKELKRNVKELSEENAVLREQQEEFQNKNAKLKRAVQNFWRLIETLENDLEKEKAVKNQSNEAITAAESRTSGKGTGSKIEKISEKDRPQAEEPRMGHIGSAHRNGLRCRRLQPAEMIDESGIR